MSDGFDPIPPPEGFGISAEEWQHTPQSVRLVVRTLLKRLEALRLGGTRIPPTTPVGHRQQTRPPKSANDGCKPPSDVSQEANLAIAGIRRRCWSQPQPWCSCPKRVLWPS